MRRFGLLAAESISLSWRLRVTVFVHPYFSHGTLAGFGDHCYDLGDKISWCYCTKLMIVENKYLYFLYTHKLCLFLLMYLRMTDGWWMDKWTVGWWFDGCMGSERTGGDRNHDDVIKWKHFPRYWPFVHGIHRSPVNSPQKQWRDRWIPRKSQWRGALVYSLIRAWINGWVNNGDAGDLRRHRAHYDVKTNT